MTVIASDGEAGAGTGQEAATGIGSVIAKSDTAPHAAGRLVALMMTTDVETLIATIQLADRLVLSPGLNIASNYVSKHD